MCSEIAIQRAKPIHTCRGLANIAVPQVAGQNFPGALSQFSEQFPVQHKIDSQSLGYAEGPLAVGYRWFTSNTWGRQKPYLEMYLSSQIATRSSK